MDEKNCYDEYIVSRDFLGQHKREHYDLKGDEVIFSSDPYVTFRDIYDNAVPVLHGHWIKMSDSDGDYYCCSNCGEELPRYSCTFPTPTNPFPLMKSIYKTNYCPHCGVKMYEKENEK